MHQVRTDTTYSDLMRIITYYAGLKINSVILLYLIEMLC